MIDWPWPKNCLRPDCIIVASMRKASIDWSICKNAQLCIQLIKWPSFLTLIEWEESSLFAYCLFTSQLIIKVVGF